MKEFRDPYIQKEYDQLLSDEEDLLDQLRPIEERIREIERNEEQL